LFEGLELSTLAAALQMQQIMLLDFFFSPADNHTIEN